MNRAVDMFTIRRRDSPSPYIDEVWSCRSVPEPVFTSTAQWHWRMVVTRQASGVRVVVRGPETRATTLPIPQDADFVGIRFAPGSYLMNVPPGRLVDRDVQLRPLANGSFVLGGSTFVAPRADDVEVLVDRFVRSGFLVRDGMVGDALAGGVASSRRTIERRTVRATGLTQGAIARIRRAEHAVDLLTKGMPAGEVASRLGYADQPHLTRSLKRLVGCTPAQFYPNGGR